MSKNKFTATATQPQCSRKFCQFNKNQYCILKNKLRQQESEGLWQTLCEVGKDWKMSEMIDDF